MEKNRVEIRSYNKVWKIENRIYAIQNIVLPVPVNPREVIYFLVIDFFIFILGAIIPGFKYIPVILRYVLIPAGLSQFLLKKKLDGKMPQKYLLSLINYMITKGDYVERFQTFPEKKRSIIKISWLCSRGNY